MDEPILTDETHGRLWYVERTLGDLSRQHAVHETVCDGRWEALQTTLASLNRTLRVMVTSIIVVALVEIGRLSWPSLINLVLGMVKP